MGKSHINGNSTDIYGLTLYMQQYICLFCFNSVPRGNQIRLVLQRPDRLFTISTHRNLETDELYAVQEAPKL